MLNNCNNGHMNQSQPALNIHAMIIVMIVIFVGVHILSNIIFNTPEQRLGFMLSWAFLPARYSDAAFNEALYVSFFLPHGDLFMLSYYVSFLSYGFLHGDWLHLVINSAWMIAFGTPIARRLGSVRFLLIFLGCTMSGALIHSLTHWGDQIPLIGASAGVAGLMAAALRFVFQKPSHGQPMGFAQNDFKSHPALTLKQSFSDPALLMMSLVFFVINLGTGFGLFGAGDGGSGIAWQAHLGGFLFGLLSFDLFDHKSLNKTPPPPPRLVS